jgi:hypothetical protein
MAAETYPSAAAGSSAVYVVSCWMCGIGLHASQLMPDGGAWCGDIRWYCKDVRACTQRWTASRRALAVTGRDQRAQGAEASRPESQRDQVAAVGSRASPPAGTAGARPGLEAGRLAPVPRPPAHDAATGEHPEAERTAASGASSHTGCAGPAPSAEDRPATGPESEEPAPNQGSASLQVAARCHQVR